MAAGIGGEMESLEPSRFKSLFGASLLAPSGVLLGALGLYSLTTHRHLHSPVLVLLAGLWCFVGGILLGQVVLQNMFPTELWGWRRTLLSWLQLPRTKRYLAHVDSGEPAVLFSPSAIRGLRSLNRICMVLVSVALIASTVDLIATDFVPALRYGSTGSDLGGLVVIGGSLVAYTVSRFIRQWVRRDSIKRSSQLGKGGN